MTEKETVRIIEKQRKFFESGSTLPVDFRISSLEKLGDCIRKNEGEIADAIKKDLGKSLSESYMSEIGLTLSEITYMIKNVRKFSREKRVPTPLAQFCSRSFKKPSPYGTVLIMSPWNYPFLLSVEPLVDAIAAGNTALIKPSAYSPYSSKAIASLIAECFPEEYVAVAEGGREENSILLNQKFDYIFFTGSKSVGRYVMRKAAENLTPVTLELGGKSPCIVDESANIKTAARRIVFGKFLNLGQTCVAPDYVYADERIKDELIENIVLEIKKQFGDNPLDNENYGRIINEKHFNRILSLIDEKKVVYGGRSDGLRIEPTVMDNVDFSDRVMGEEIFGPVLPVLTFKTLDEAVLNIKKIDKPLALYIFTSNKKNEKFILERVGFGGGCVNDTVIHLATSDMGFGGFGESGLGSYHGRDGFEAFSHSKSVVDKKTWIDLPMRYQPYNKLSDRLIRIFLR